MYSSASALAHSRATPKKPNLVFGGPDTCQKIFRRLSDENSTAAASGSHAPGVDRNPTYLVLPTPLPQRFFSLTV